MSRSLRRNIITALSIATLVGVGVGAVPFARERVRRGIELRCGKAVEGGCTVASVELSSHGVVAHTLVVRGPLGATAQVERLEAQLQWWPLLTGKPQAVRVRVDGLRASSPRAMSEVAVAWRRLRGPGTGAGTSKVTLDALSIERVDVNAALIPGVGATLERGRVEWVRGGDLSVEWHAASLSMEGVQSVQAGSCNALLTSDATRPMVLNCSGFSGEIDVATASERVAALRESVQRARTELLGASAIGGRASVLSRVTSVPTVQINGREGTLSITRAGQRIAVFSPAIVAVEVADRRVRHAHVRLGGAGAGPAVELDANVTDPERWRIELEGDGLPLAEVARWVPAVPWFATELGRVRMRASLEPEAAGTVLARGELSIERFGLSHAKLAHDPVTDLSVSLQGDARIDLARRRVETTGLVVAVNNVAATLTGWVERDRAHERVALDVRAHMNNTSCDVVRTSLPRSLTGPVAELTLAGTIGGSVRLALDTTLIQQTIFDVALENRCVVARDTYTRGVGRFSAPFVQRVMEPTGERAFVTGPGTAVWVPLFDVSPYMQNALLSREDGRFYRHAGVDPQEIRNAIVRNVSAGRFVYGASTISMQLAKNVFLAREKTLVRKMQEFVLTWYLEQMLGKDAILELYLNVVEFGPGVYGIGPASRFFFGREPSQLTPLQAIYLATLLPNPVGRFGSYQRQRVSEGTLAMLRAHARIMGTRGLLTPEELAASQTEAIVFRAPRAPTSGALTLQVDTLLTDDVAVARALAMPVPASAPPVPTVQTAAQEESEDVPTEGESEDRAEPVTNVPTPVSAGGRRGAETVTIR